MNEYIVLARKYRPESFETLIGQDNIATTLKNSIKRGQLAHAYLFCGPRGVGKTTTARIFAKMINCSSPLENGDPCGVCESCRSFAEGRSYCIHEMDAASNNSVDDIKELIDKVRVAPQVGRYSVYIIDEVHMLSQQAFNAFLKTLEEPPEYAIFILATTEKHKILPTILSRCQTYDFNRMGIGDIVRNLRNIAAKENITVDEESLHVIALKADGAMRDALTIFDQTIAFCGTDIKYADVIRNLNVLDYDYCFNLTDRFLSGDYASAMRTFDEILAKGFNALHFISALSSHFRDLMVAKAGGIDSLLELAGSLKTRYHEQAASCSEKFLYEALGLTTSCEQGYKASVNPRLHIEFTLMRLSFLNRTPAAAQQTSSATAQTPQSPAQAVRTAPASGPAAQQAVAVSQPAPARTADPVQPSTAAAHAAVPQQEPVSRPMPVPEPQPLASAAPQHTQEPQPEARQTVQQEPLQPVRTAAAPSAAPDTAPAARPARRMPVGGASGTVSVKAIVQDEKKAESAKNVTVADRDLTDEEIHLGWKKLCDASRSSERLWNALANAKLETERRDGVIYLTYKVTNESQKMWLAEKNFRIEAKYRELAGSSKVRLIIDVQPEDRSSKAAVSAEDKAKEMIAANPKVAEAVSELGLELK